MRISTPSVKNALTLNSLQGKLVQAQDLAYGLARLADEEPTALFKTLFGDTSWQSSLEELRTSLYGKTIRTLSEASSAAAYQVFQRIDRFRQERSLGGALAPDFSETFDLWAARELPGIMNDVHAVERCFQRGYGPWRGTGRFTFGHLTTDEVTRWSAAPSLREARSLFESGWTTGLKLLSEIMEHTSREKDQALALVFLRGYQLRSNIFPPEHV